MTVSALCEQCGFTAIALPEGDREINGCYIGDLLSWVMGRACEGNAWITIMSNINIVAVASLVDTSCIILSEGVTLHEDVVKTAETKGVNIISSSLASYETAVKISQLI